MRTRTIPTGLEIAKTSRFSVARNLPAWIIATDYIWEYLFNQYGGGNTYFDVWEPFLKSVTTKKLNTDSGSCTRDSGDQSIIKACYDRSNNWAAWSMATMAATAAYLETMQLQGATLRWNRADSTYKGYVGDRSVHTWGSGDYTATGWDTLYTGQLFSPVAQATSNTWYCDGGSCTGTTYPVEGMLTQEMRRGQTWLSSYPNDIGPHREPSGQCWYASQEGTEYHAEDAASYTRSTMGAIGMTAHLINKTGPTANIHTWGSSGSSGNGLQKLMTFWAAMDAGEGGSVNVWSFVPPTPTTSEKIKVSWVPWLVNGLVNSGIVSEASLVEGTANVRYCAGTRWLKAEF